MSEQAAAAEEMAMPKHGQFCWTEIASDNLEACKTFYTEVFGWNLRQSDNNEIGMEYLEFGTNSRNSGGMFEMKAEWYGGTMPPPHYNVYVTVDNVDETASKAFDLGGTIVGPPMDVPGVGRICQIEDPTGAKISIITMKS